MQNPRKGCILDSDHRNRLRKPFSLHKLPIAGQVPLFAVTPVTRRAGVSSSFTEIGRQHHNAGLRFEFPHRGRPCPLPLSQLLVSPSTSPPPAMSPPRNRPFNRSSRASPRATSPPRNQPSTPTTSSTRPRRPPAPLPHPAHRPRRNSRKTWPHSAAPSAPATSLPPNPPSPPCRAT